MKRGTTPTLPIRIRMSFENIKSIEFIFKEQPSEYAKSLLYKIFDKNIPVLEKEDSSFVVGVKLTAEETMKLPAGEIYIDTRIVLEGDVIPKTKMVKKDVLDTLFGQVYKVD